MLKATDGNTTVYYTRGFELISRREGAAASYYVYDGGLSVRALTNEAGTVTDTLVFDAFGNETGRTGTTDNPYGFQGEEQDATGLYYLRARYMDPVTGSFTTMDTYGGSLSDSMSLHKYLFANSNPVMYCDPSGHMSKLAEQVVVVGIMATLCAEMDGILYVFNLEDNNIYLSKTDFLSGLSDTLTFGVCKGILFGLLTVGLICIVGAAIAAIVLGCLGLGLSVLEIYNGISDYENGYTKTGIAKIAFGIIGVIFSSWSIFKGVKGVVATNSQSSGKTVQDILKNKTLTNQTGKVDNYTSPIKGQQEAINDFNALKPSNVRTYSNGTTVGDLPNGQTVNIHASSTLNGTPSLEIYDSQTNTSIKIRY